jgi:hypothetical protein
MGRKLNYKLNYSLVYDTQLEIREDFFLLHTHRNLVAVCESE